MLLIMSTEEEEEGIACTLVVSFDNGEAFRGVEGNDWCL